MKYSIICCLLFAACTSTRNQTKAPSRFCVVVDQVRYGKKTSVIRPKSNTAKPIKYWFHYPTINVHPGDTVDISINDRVEPKF